MQSITSAASQTINSTTFAGINRANVRLFVPLGTTQFYLNADWTGFIIIEPDGAHTINEAQYILEGSNAALKKYYGNANTFTIPQVVMINGISRTVVKIGNSAFANQTGLTGITIPAGVTNIGSQAFYGCSSLTNITIPAGVTAIGYQAFYGCNNLTAFNVDHSNSNYISLDGVLYTKSETGGVGSYLLAYPSAKTATSFTIPAGVIEIAPYAFALRFRPSVKSPLCFDFSRTN